eukprot:Lithocolla_globosa_v1_NODE_1599_length_2457_cov_19.375520.p2 type:complete len:233 gc:universal NODE_1599_length_2457_cov_19.375520:1900-1202(-)
MISYNSMHSIQTLQLIRHLLPQFLQIHQLCQDLIRKLGVVVLRRHNAARLQVTQVVLGLDGLLLDARVGLVVGGRGEDGWERERLALGGRHAAEDLNNGGFGVEVEKLVGANVLSFQCFRQFVINGGLPTREESELEWSVFGARKLLWGGPKICQDNPQVVVFFWNQGIHVFYEQLVCVVQFIEGDIERDLLFRQSNVLINLQLFEKVLDLTQIEEELGHSLLVVVHKAVER